MKFVQGFPSGLLLLSLLHLLLKLVIADEVYTADDGVLILSTDTYQQTCELPSFEWAAFGTRLTGRLYTRRAALLGDSLFAAGYLKSTGAPDKEDFEETDEDFCVTGPYNIRDPTGFFFSSVLCSDLISYTTEHGSFAQYEVGVVKINATTGEPEDIYVYYGEGQDETCGLAVKEIASGDNIMALSGHFVGSLTAENGDGNSITIYNSNSEGTADYVQHPNAIKNGFDDGFIISADADTGDANWMVAHPTSNKDAQTVGVDLDNDGNIFGAGYFCNQIGEGEESPVICDGFVAKFAANDGTLLWEQNYTDLGAAMWLVYDEIDDALYVTGTTSYKGELSNITTDTKNHKQCQHEICAVTMRLSASDGTTDWIRTTKGSPRWNFFDQTGDIRLANNLDGPYIYVALDDIGEGDIVTLDEGTPYAACRDENGTLTPEYSIRPDKIVTEDDCPIGSTFIPRTDEDNALPAVEAATGATCGSGHEGVDACVIKYHKYTGLPIWGANIHPVAGLVPSPDGQSIMAAGFYWHHDGYGHGYNFDSIELPDYNGIEGSYNAKLNAKTGQGEYVMHSGGVGKTRVYDIVGSPEGDIYMVGYTQSAVINWGGTLQTKIIEEGIDQNDDAGTAFQMGKVSSNTNEYQFFAVKLAASDKALPSCVESCSLEGGNIANPIIKNGHCLIDNVCYMEDETSEIFGRPCLSCNPEQNQTGWSFGATIGERVCLIDNVCYDKGDFYSYSESRKETYMSQCQMCSPTSNATGWSIISDYMFVSDVDPPNDCINITDSPTKSPVVKVTQSPIAKPIQSDNESAGTVSSSASSNVPCLVTIAIISLLNVLF